MRAPRPRPRARRPRCGVGRLVSADEAGGTVLTAVGRLRATWGGPVLVACAAGSALPRPGDLVTYMCWPDGRVTLDSGVAAPTSSTRATRG